MWPRLPQDVQAVLHQRHARLFVINAAKIARECKLGARINTVMQMAFFHLTQILPTAMAQEQLRAAIERSYSNKGAEIVTRNWQALDATLEALIEIPLQPIDENSPVRPPIVSDQAPDFVKTVTATMLAGLGDTLPVSAFPPDGTWPVGTTQWENAILQKTSPSGSQTFVHNVITVSLPAHTRLSVPKWYNLRPWPVRRTAYSHWMLKPVICVGRNISYKWRPKIVLAATCVMKSALPKIAKIQKSKRLTCGRVWNTGR